MNVKVRDIALVVVLSLRQNNVEEAYIKKIERLLMKDPISGIEIMNNDFWTEIVNKILANNKKKPDVFY